ncbi:unnamed protein product [Oncorhynchus mykiss]|uniref:Uncharacterized protein n=1 Tax=Oncorhynchus mykiss TaxID=8022 RepID=A0A060VWV2_ONCMY|nr:unnamed protein product [Oncorhynchus mykiss]
MRRLQETNAGFNFPYTEDPNYGPFLVNVNGVAGNNTENFLGDPCIDWEEWDHNQT